LGLGTIEVEMLIHEHAYRPITGEILAIGRQHISPSGAAVLDRLRAHGVVPRSTKFEVDKLDTHHSADLEPISDASFFAAFSDAAYLVADISPYEAADFIFDICDEAPADLLGRFDFILDGGSLDNVFDPVSMIANLTKMLKPGGRMFINAWSNGFPTAYVKITPDWLMDFCAVNEFADCKVYVSRHEAPGGLAEFGQSVDLFHFDPLVETPSGPAFESASIKLLGVSSIYAILEKGTTAPMRTAVQQHYRGEGVEPYLASATRFRASRRPIFALPGKATPEMAPISDMPTVRPVARFGEKVELSPHDLILRQLDKLLVEQAIMRATLSRQTQLYDVNVSRIRRWASRIKRMVRGTAAISRFSKR
jgi:SAM-dependent methyltransferase